MIATAQSHLSLLQKRVNLKLWSVVFLCLCCNMLGGCEVQTRIIKPSSHYDMAVPRHIRTTANLYKTSFAEHKLEDEEIDESLSETVQKQQFVSDFERAVSVLYVGNINSESGQRQVYDLIRYATGMFSEDDIYEQLASRSEPLADFVIDYQINAALSESKKKIAQTMENEKQAQLAAQQEEFDALVEKFERTIATYDKKIAEYEAMLSQ